MCLLVCYFVFQEKFEDLRSKGCNLLGMVVAGLVNL